MTHEWTLCCSQDQGTETKVFQDSREIYTACIKSYSNCNLQLITLELLLAGDVELNPGDDSDSFESNIQKLKLPDKGLIIGEWNFFRKDRAGQKNVEV